MNKTHALQNLLEGKATEEEIALLKRLLASGEISIGGNVNQSVIIIGSGNTVELPPAALDRLNARPMLGNLDRDLTGEEIASGLRRLDKLLPNRAPILLPHYKEQVGRLRPTLKTEVQALSESSRRERLEALAAINSICVEAVDVSFNGLALSEAAPDYDARSPFRGLESFRPEDSEFFFGREELTQKLVGKIKAHSFLAVLGASGSGKSSLVMAGMIPALNLDYAIIRPGTTPLEALDSARGKSLLVVDQFEELFTLTRDEKTRADFISALLSSTKGGRVIITLRSDFLGEAGAYRSLSGEIQNHLEIIPPMNSDELRRAMEGQARWARLEFEADLSQQILDDVAGEPGAMPLLQHALWELWNRRHGRHLRANEYRAFGGVKQAITSTAEKVYAECSKPEQDQVHDIFLRLTRLDEGDEGRDTRRRVSLGDLIPSGADAASISAQLDKLANARLIVQTVNDDVTEIEVAHEALIRHWERLRIWLNEDRDSLRLRESVSESAKEWERSGRHESLLNSRWVKLDEALLLAQYSCYRLTENEQAYLESCAALRNREQQERERRLRLTLIASSVVTIIFLFLGGFALLKGNEAQKQAQIALARQLAAQAQSLLANDDPKQRLSVLLAAQSLRLFQTSEAAQIIQNSTLANPVYSFDHNALVDVIAFSPDGKYVASGGRNNMVCVWDIETGRAISRIVHSGKTNDECSATSATLDVKTDNVMLGDAGVVSVAFSPDSGYIVSVGLDYSNYLYTARVWSIETGEEVFRSKDASIAYSVEFSPDGRYVISGGSGGIVHLWDASTGREISKLKWKGTVTSMALSPDGGWAISGSDDGTIHLWDINTGQEIFQLKHGGAVQYVAFSPGGEYAISANGFEARLNETVRLWNVNSGRQIIEMTCNGSTIFAVAFSPDDRHIVMGCSDGTVHVWDVVRGREISNSAFSSVGVGSLAFSPDGKYAASSGSSVNVWEVMTGHRMFTKNLSGLVHAIAFSPDGKYVLSGNDDGTARVWDALTGREITRMTHDGSVYAVAFSPDGRLAISAGNDRTIKVWETGPKKWIFQPSNSAGQRGNTGYEGENTESGQELNRIKDKVGTSVISLSLSPDNKLAVSGGTDGMVRIWDVATAQELVHMEHGGLVLSVLFSPDGKYVASGNCDRFVFEGPCISGSARIWDASLGREILRVVLDGGVKSVAFSPDGEYLAFNGAVNILVVDISTRQVLGRMDYQTEAVSFSFDGAYVVADSDHMWLYQSKDLIFDACSRVTRNLTRAEWQRYIGDALPYQAVCSNLPIDVEVTAVP